MGSRVITALMGRFFLIGLFLSTVFWFGEAFIHTFIFGEAGFLEQVFPSNNGNGLWMRLIVVSILIGFSLYSQMILSKKSEAEDALKESRELYSTLAESGGGRHTRSR